MVRLRYSDNGEEQVVDYRRRGGAQIISEIIGERIDTIAFVPQKKRYASENAGG